MIGRRVRRAVAAEGPLHRLRPVTTPEGIELPFALATAGERFGAFVVDFLVIAGSIVALVLLTVLAATPWGRPGWLLAFLFLAVFALQNFYFVWFELRRGGSTPGKRRLGIRVMDARGGPLEAEAVVARNLMRNLELWLPLAFVLAPERLMPDLPGWAAVFAGLWILVFAFLPLFNAQRLRAGDLVAGTVVVVAPKDVLLPDLARAKPARAAAAARSFTEGQLSVYGVYELQVLEDVLRREPSSPGLAEALDAVAEKIARKIRYEPVPSGAAARGFLTDFYAALRARLEQRMLFGRRKKDKHARED